MEADSKIILTINDLAIISGLATLIFTINNSVSPFEITNVLLLFDGMLYIHHLMRFKKHQPKVQALLDFDSEVNVMLSAYASKLDLKICLINIET